MLTQRDYGPRFGVRDLVALGLDQPQRRVAVDVDERELRRAAGKCPLDRRQLPAAGPLEQMDDQPLGWCALLTLVAGDEAAEQLGQHGLVGVLVGDWRGAAGEQEVAVLAEGGRRTE